MSCITWSNLFKPVSHRLHRAQWSHVVPPCVCVCVFQLCWRWMVPIVSSSKLFPLCSPCVLTPGTPTCLSSPVSTWDTGAASEHIVAGRLNEGSSRKQNCKDLSFRSRLWSGFCSWLSTGLVRPHCCQLCHKIHHLQSSQSPAMEHWKPVSGTEDQNLVPR